MNWSLTLPTLNWELRFPAANVLSLLTFHISSKEKKSGSNWHLFHHPRMFQALSIALYVSVKPAVLGQTQAYLAPSAGLLQ